MVSFTQLLIYNAIALTFVFYILLPVASKASKGRPRTPPVFSQVLKTIMISLLLAYIAFQITSLVRGYRDPAVFGLMTSLSMVMLFYVLSYSSAGNSTLVLLSLLMVSLSEPLTLYIGNDFYPRWDWASDTILTTGRLDEYFRGIISAGLYYLIPVSYIRQVMLALICQPSHITPFINVVAEYLVCVISIYAFFKRSRFGVLAGVLSVIILISSPGDNVLTGRLVGSLILPFMLSSLIYYRTGWTSALISSLLLMVGTVFQHGSPVVGYLLLFLSVLLRGWEEDLELRGVSRRVGTIVATLSVIASVYWVYTHIINQVSRVGYSFVNSFISYFLPTQREVISPWTYTPRYESESYLVYSYTWAFPVALSVALLLNYMTKVLTQRSGASLPSIGEASSFLAATVAGASFIAYRVAESGQYFIPVGYFLALISSTIALSRIFEGKHLGVLLVATVLLATFTYTGVSSPAHAHLEHPEFETAAQIFRSTRYIEASLVSRLLDPQIRVYYDYDLPIRGGIYKTIREKLYLILEGYDPRALEQGSVVYAIKNERLSGAESILRVSSIVYRSNFYTLFYVVS